MLFYELILTLKVNAYLKQPTTQKNDWVDRFAKLLDSEFRIPGTDIRFGLDPIIGLIPGLGDVLGYVASAVIVLGIVQKGVSGKVILQMLGNILLDMLIGLVPFLGSFFDFVYKANDRNIQLLKEYQQEQNPSGEGDTIILEGASKKGNNTGLIVISVLLALIILFAFLLFLVAAITMRFLGGLFA